VTIFEEDMEIIIRTDQMETAVQPAAAQPSAERLAVAPASVLAQAAAVDAVNAGPAPAAPGQPGTPPVHVAATEYSLAESGSASSAGAAPDIP
jgi:hypothetical protein